MRDINTVASCTRTLENHKHAISLVSNLEQLRSTNILCDITLVCGKIQINAHKIVLAACSEYFQAMFTSGMCETRTDEVSTLNPASWQVNIEK